MSRRLLLINPAHMLNGRVQRGPAQFPIPPLNLGYVAALTPPSWEVRIIDENLRLEEELSTATRSRGADGPLAPNAPRAYALAQRYRAAGIIVLGGIHARRCR